MFKLTDNTRCSLVHRKPSLVHVSVSEWQQEETRLLRQPAFRLLSRHQNASEVSKLTGGLHLLQRARRSLAVGTIPERAVD